VEKKKAEAERDIPGGRRDDQIDRGIGKVLGSEKL